MKRILKWVALVLVALVAALGLTFWLRPLAVFRLFNHAQMYLIGAQKQLHRCRGIPHPLLRSGTRRWSQSWFSCMVSAGARRIGRSLRRYLAKAGYRVYLPDLPGFGQSEKPADFSYSVSDEAKIVTGFFDALGLKQVDLGGWSMGGWIVQLVAAQHPERVRRLMLFDSAGLYVKPDWDTKLFTPVSAAELDKFDALLMPHPPQLPGIRSERHSSHLARARLDHPSCDGRDADGARHDRQSSPKPQNAGADRVGRSRPHHSLE